MGIPKKDPTTKLKETVGRRQKEFEDRFKAFDKSRKERTGEKVISEILGKIAQVTADPSKLSAAEFPPPVLAQIRQCVQLLAHEEDKFKVTSICVLAEIMMRFPVLVDCIVNNILSIYHKPRKLYQRQAKLLGIGCVLRYGLHHVGIRVLQRLIAEIVLVRYSSNKDDVEIFFLITALQDDSKVAVVSHLIVEGMSGDLNKPISCLKPTTLWLRVVLAERMMSQGLDLPVWLHDTFIPKQVDAYGEILLPKSQKLAANHPIFANFIDLLASYYQYRTARQLTLGLQPIPSPVLVFFKNRVAPTIINCYRLAGKKITFELAYRFLMSILMCRKLDLDTLERVVQWSVAGEGLNFFLTMDKRPLKQALCHLILSFDNLQGPYDRSRLALCVLQGSLVVPKLRHVAQQRLEELNQEHAHNCVNNAVNLHWAQRLSEREAGLMLKLVTLPQCRGEDNKMWRQQVSEGLVKRALRWEDSLKRRHLYEEEIQEYSGALKKQKESEEKADQNETEGSKNGDEEGSKNDEGEKKAQENGDGQSELQNGEETSKLPWEQPLQQFTEKPVMSKGSKRAFYSKDLDSTRLFFRFLVHAAQDHDTVYHLIISAFNTAAEEVKKDQELLRLDTERYDCFKKLCEHQQLLSRGSARSARLRLLLQVILSQLGLELLLKCARDTEDIIQDFIPCIKQYLDEEGELSAEQERRGQQMLQEYEEKLKELEKENQRLRRRKKREMQRMMQGEEEEEDANLIPLPGQDPSEMPDFSKHARNNAKGEDDDQDHASNAGFEEKMEENDTDCSNKRTETSFFTANKSSDDEEKSAAPESMESKSSAIQDSGDDGRKSSMEGNEDENDGVLEPVTGESKWLGVLVDLLLALCTRSESWWRVALKPTAFLLAGRMNSELLGCVTEVLFNEDLVEPVKKQQGEEDDEENEEEESNKDEDQDSSDDEGKTQSSSSAKNKAKSDGGSEDDDEMEDEEGTDDSEVDGEEDDTGDSEMEDEESMDVEETEDMETDQHKEGMSKSKAKKKKNVKSSEEASKKKKKTVSFKADNEESDDEIYSDDSDDDDDDDDEDNDDESEDGEKSDEDDDDEPEEEVEVETSLKRSKLEEMKGELFKVLGPTGADDAVEEDMDKVPPEELRALNIQLGAVLGAYIKKKKKVNPNALSGRTADIVQFRNRALDIVEGLIDGPLACELLLRELLLPLLQTMALHMEERMNDLNNRLRKAVQHIRNKKKYINVGDMSIEKFQECLVELFDVAKAVPETKHGFVTLIRCSMRFCEQKGILHNPIIPAYVSMARNFLHNAEVEASIVLEPLFLEVPELQSALCRGVVEEIFAPVVEEEEDEDDFKAKCRKIFEKKKEFPNNYPVLDGKMTTIWLLLEALFSHILPKTERLSDDERWAVLEVVRHIEHYTKACDQPKLKDVAVLNFVLKVILRYPSSKECVDWNTLCETLFQYRARMSRQPTTSKGVKMELKKLLDSSLRSYCPHAISILRDRRTKKNQKQAQRKEKRQAQKRKLEDPTTVEGSKAQRKAEAYKEAKKGFTAGNKESIDDLFDANSKYIDEDDPDLDVDERLPKKRRIEEEAEADILKKAKEIRAAKTAHNRKKRQRSKLSKKSKKAALAKLKEMERLRKMKEGSEGAAGANQSDPKTSAPQQTNKDSKTEQSASKTKKPILKSKGKEKKDSKLKTATQEKKVPQRLVIKANRKKAEAALDKDLQPGVFKYCKGRRLPRE